MKDHIISVFCWLSVFSTNTNNEVFYVSGNQQIPITETYISMKRDVLTINRVGNRESFRIKQTIFDKYTNLHIVKPKFVGKMDDLARKKRNGWNFGAINP